MANILILPFFKPYTPFLELRTSIGVSVWSGFSVPEDDWSYDFHLKKTVMSFMLCVSFCIINKVSATLDAVEAQKS